MQALISGASQDVCVQHNASNALNALEMICEIGLNTRTEEYSLSQIADWKAISLRKRMMESRFVLEEQPFIDQAVS